MKPVKKTLISIVNWNNNAATNKCLAGITQIPKAQQPDVVVVDNGSRQEEFSIEDSLKTGLRSLKLVKNGENLGFAGGHNPNIKYAKEQGYDYIVLLNNDTEIIDKELFDKLAAALGSNAKALGANPTILSSKEPNIVWYGGGRLSLRSGQASHLGVGNVEPAGSQTAKVSLLTGGCLAIALARADLDQLLLSEDYFLYWEDTDWSARALRAGFELLYVPEARLLHQVSSGLGIRSPFYIYYNIRNHFLFIRRNVRPLFWPLAWTGVLIIGAKYKFNILFRYKQGRWVALMALWSGARDGVLGKTGQSRRIDSVKKILMISGSLPPIRCGVGYYTHKLLQELPSDANLEVMSTEGVKEDLGKVTYVVPNWKISSLPTMLRNIKASNAQIIHIQYPAVGYRRNLGINLLPYALRLTKPKLKLLVTLHEYHESRLLGRWRDFITVWPAHQIIVSNQLDHQALGRLGRKTTIIPIGANFDKAAKDPTVYGQLMIKHKLDASQPVLMFFGFAEPNKRVEVLLDTLIEPGLENYQVLLLSSLDKRDAYQQMLLARVGELNFDKKRVAVAGFLPNDKVSAVLQEGKYFVLPQQQPLSPKSSTAITAVINGLILISAGSSNPQETLPFENGKNCLLISPVDSANLAKAITMIDKDSAAQANLKTGALELAGYFSWPTIIKQQLEVYETL